MSINIEETRNIRFNHINLVFEPEYQMVWARLRYPGRPCMSEELLRDVARAQQIVAEKATGEYQQDHASRSPPRLNTPLRAEPST
ncbi:MAG TPA: hypothetical protein PLZ16_08100 [Gammaproteobacteria bacterium]|nr:hypothetical protein [Gammaproteobacteria bacterium]